MLKLKKAISPLTATLLLIAIAVAASIITYMWVMSIIESQVPKISFITYNKTFYIAEKIYDTKGGTLYFYFSGLLNNTLVITKFDWYHGELRSLTLYFPLEKEYTFTLEQQSFKILEYSNNSITLTWTVIV